MGEEWLIKYLSILRGSQVLKRIIVLEHHLLFHNHKKKKSYNPAIGSLPTVPQFVSGLLLFSTSDLLNTI